ncbi:MAG: chitobiase/beta-hexosaminidase C-terminal domain-containing protein [Prevotella sp.]|nr:chitobiase/beta-hexosaminidase C-terminal domain-containing protein [Prevotella sp.]
MTSITLTVANDASFTDIVDEVTLSDISKTMTFIPSSGKKWENAYYKLYFVWNNTATSSNNGMDVEKIDFFNVSGGSTDPTTNTITITPGTSTFTKATDITMSATIDGTKIYYTTDGTEPSASSTLYEGAFKVTQSGTTVKAVAIAEGYDNVTAEATYTIKPDQPVFSDESKLFKDAFDVTLSLPETTDATSTIHYAIGSTATAESDVYTGAINISSETDGDKIILHAVVVDEYGNVGTEKYCTYTKTTSIVFDFTQRPNVWNIEPVNYNKDGDSNVAGKDLAVDGIVMTSTNGDSYITCIYATTSDPNLRVYTGGTITFTAPEGYNLSEIKFTGSSLGNFECYTDHYSNSTWTGNAHAVTFTASGSVQVKTASIKIVPASSEVPTDVTLHVGDALYSTLYYSDRALVVPENTEAYTYTVTNGQLVESYRYDENETIPAGVGVVVFALEAGEYTFAVSSQAGDVDEDNMLKGSDEDALTVGGDVYYKLSLNAENEDGTIGFYWGAEDGAAFTNKAHKAYLALTKEAAGAAKSFLLDGTTNGIGNISVQKTMNAPLYNISGQRVGKSYKGMVISNGKKYIQK